MADVLHLAALTADGQVGAELARLVLEDGDVHAEGEELDLAMDTFEAIARRYRALTRVELFDRLSQDGWSNGRISIYSTTPDE